MSALGRHILVEFFGCKPEVMNDVSLIETSMVDAALKANATVINSTFHHFSPFGVSGVVVIQESHLAIHTWPEYQYAAVDLFTCGDTVDPWKSFDHLKIEFGATNYSALETGRGNLNLLDRIDFDVRDSREKAEKRMQASKYNRNVWFTDKDDNQALSLRFTGEVLYDKTSEYQRTKVIDTYAYGKTLTIDNMVMCTEKDEYHYHEMITHPALLSHGKVRRALIIGGGDGGTAREILKHSSVEKVVMVEIDENVVEASRLHLPTLSQSFNHPKLELIIGDGIKYVRDAADESFDLIIVDGSDPVGPAEGLFNLNFYKDCYRVLTPEGMIAAQGESPMFNQKAFHQINTCLKDVAGKHKVKTLLFHIPTYPSGVWSIQIASKGKINPLEAMPEQIRAFVQNQNLNYYNEDIHRAAFMLPNYVKRLLNEI